MPEAAVALARRNADGQRLAFFRHGQRAHQLLHASLHRFQQRPPPEDAAPQDAVQLQLCEQQRAAGGAPGGVVRRGRQAVQESEERGGEGDGLGGGRLDSLQDPLHLLFDGATRVRRELR